MRRIRTFSPLQHFFKTPRGLCKPGSRFAASFLRRSPHCRREGAFSSLSISIPRQKSLPKRPRPRPRHLFRTGILSRRADGHRHHQGQESRRRAGRKDYLPHAHRRRARTLIERRPPLEQADLDETEIRPAARRWQHFTHTKGSDFACGAACAQMCRHCRAHPAVPSRMPNLFRPTSS